MRVLTHLWFRTGEERFRERAETLLSAFSPYLSQYPSGFGYLLTAASELLSGETGARHYVARGNVRVKAERVGGDKLAVNIDIAPGWHINADKPLQDYLIGTRLVASKDHGEEAPLDNLVYPQAQRAVLGFERSELALYDGSITINASLPAATGQPIVPLTLDLQACNDKICLPPETVALNLSIATERN